MLRNWSLKKKFITIFLVLIAIPTILFGFLIYFHATKAFKEEAQQNISSRLEKNEGNLLSIIEGIENMSSYMIFEENFRTFLKTPPEEVQEITEAEVAIRGYFTFQLMSYDYIVSIELKGTKGSSLNIGNHMTGNELHLKEAAIKNEGAPHWSNTYQVTNDRSEKLNVISLTRVINDINHISQPIGYVKIRLDESLLYKTVEVDQTQQGEYFVLSSTGDVVLHQDSSLVGKPFPNSSMTDLILDSKKQTITYKENGDTFLIVKKKIEGTDWLSVVMVNQDNVVEGLYDIRSLIVNMIILLSLLGVIAFTGFYYWHIKPIVELTEQTKQLEKGDFSAKVSTKSNDEVGELGKRFNQMVVKIQKYIDMEYKLKINQKESELKALQNQIDPHFLYNTLDMIRWTARIENALDTGRLIELLSKNFRMNLNKGKMWVTLEEEINYIDNYLELQRSRMGDRLDFSIFIDDQVKNAYLLKQMLQPLIENSILHGFKALPGQGIINIRCYKVDNELWIDTIDNGWGFSKDVGVLKSNLTSGYALNNLTERMRIAFGENFGMELLDTEQGAWIRLRLPLLDESDIHLTSKGEERP